MTGAAEIKNAPAYYEGQGRFRGFTGNGLKLFAMAVMLIDHIACAWSLDLVNYDVYYVLRVIGRFAFPIFAYMIAVGARHTHDIRKYLLRLTAFAVLSEVPFDLAFGFASPGQWIEWEHQNVFLTLLLGLLALAFLRFFQKRLGRFYMIPTVAVLILLMIAANFLNTDYADMGVLSIFLFYVFADKRQGARTAGFALAILVLAFDWQTLLNLTELFAVAALPLILLHNGQKGVKMNRWVFYAFYPGHLLLLYLLGLLVKPLLGV